MHLPVEEVALVDRTCHQPVTSAQMGDWTPSIQVLLTVAAAVVVQTESVQIAALGLAVALYPSRALFAGALAWRTLGLAHLVEGQVAETSPRTVSELETPRPVDSGLEAQSGNSGAWTVASLGYSGVY